MSLVKRIDVLCKQRNTTLTAIERECGLGISSIRKWDDHSPSLTKVMAVADALDVSVSDLIGEQEKKPTPVPEDGLALDKSLVERLVQLSPEEQKMVEAFVQGMIAERSTNGT